MKLIITVTSCKMAHNTNKMNQKWYKTKLNQFKFNKIHKHIFSSLRHHNNWHQNQDISKI